MHVYMHTHTYTLKCTTVHYNKSFLWLWCFILIVNWRRFRNTTKTILRENPERDTVSKDEKTTLNICHYNAWMGFLTEKNKKPSWTLAVFFPLLFSISLPPFGIPTLMKWDDCLKLLPECIFCDDGLWRKRNPWTVIQDEYTTEKTALPNLGLFCKSTQAVVQVYNP